MNYLIQHTLSILHSILRFIPKPSMQYLKTLETSISRPDASHIHNLLNDKKYSILMLYFHNPGYWILFLTRSQPSNKKSSKWILNLCCSLMINDRHVMDNMYDTKQDVDLRIDIALYYKQIKKSSSGTFCQLEIR